MTENTISSSCADFKLPSIFISDGCIHSFYLTLGSIIHIDPQTHIHLYMCTHICAYDISKTSSFKHFQFTWKIVMFSKCYACSLKLPVCSTCGNFKNKCMLILENGPINIQKKIIDIPGYCYVLFSKHFYIYEIVLYMNH